MPTAAPRPGLAVTWRTSDGVATVDRFGNVTALKPGAVTISASAEGSRRASVHGGREPGGAHRHRHQGDTLSTGDVVHLTAVARRANGDAGARRQGRLELHLHARRHHRRPRWPGHHRPGPDNRSSPPTRRALHDHGAVGDVVARTVLDVKPRDVRRRITVTGRGVINTTATSDLWPWTGKDGRDYCLVGTWGGDGYGSSSTSPT
jgi:hypothetical protein